MTIFLNKDNYLHILPPELQALIFSFDPTMEHLINVYINKHRENSKKIRAQFYKGGFHRANLRTDLFIKDEARWCRMYWRANHPEITHKTSIIIKDWDLKTANGRCKTYCYYSKKWKIRLTGTRPVSKWIENINKFETHNLELSKTLYFHVTRKLGRRFTTLEKIKLREKSKREQK